MLKNEDLKIYIWKFSDGLYLGEVIIFEKHTMKIDTIYEIGNAKYVVKTSIGYFGYPTKIRIQDLKTLREVVYVGK